MRILHISTRLILGGSQENTVLSCEGQARRGHEIHLAFGPIRGPEGSLLARVEAFNARCASGEEASVAPIGTHLVPSLVREISPLNDRRCVRELRDLIRRIDPDVVHTHSSKAGILGRIAAWSPTRERPRVVHTIHGPPFMPVDGGPIHRVRRRLTNAAYTLAERYAAKRCDAIVAVADAMTAQFLARGIGKSAQYTTVRSGMEVEKFLTASAGEDRFAMRHAIGFDEGDFVIGTVARLAEHKGHDDLLDALADDLRNNPRWKLLWVGDGWWRERLSARAKELGLGVRELDRAPPLDASMPHASMPSSLSTSETTTNRDYAAQVILTGLVPSERVAPHIRAMDVLVHPSSREGLPRTVPQALLCGVCPVAYDADGTREACRDGETGLLAPVGDRGKLRSAVARLASDAPLRARLAATGREWCAKEFSVERMLDGLEAVYANAGASGRQPR